MHTAMYADHPTSAASCTHIRRTRPPMPWSPSDRVLVEALAMFGFRPGAVAGYGPRGSDQAVATSGSITRCSCGVAGESWRVGVSPNPELPSSSVESSKRPLRRAQRQQHRRQSKSENSEERLSSAPCSFEHQERRTPSECRVNSPGPRRTLSLAEAISSSMRL